MLEFSSCAANCSDCSFSTLRECVCFHSKLSLEFTISKNLHQLLCRDEASCDEFLTTNLLKILCLSESLNRIEINRFILYTVDILETELRHTTLQRHLTAFETNLLAVARTCLSTLVTTR